MLHSIIAIRRCYQSSNFFFVEVVALLRCQRPEKIYNAAFLLTVILFLFSDNLVNLTLALLS